MFKTIDVWKTMDENCAVRYRCFQILPNGGYYVQSKDYYHLPINEDDIIFLEKQFVELLIQEPPNQRDRIYSTLEEAIARHDRDFEI